MTRSGTWVLAVDFGTTNTVAAIADERDIRTLIIDGKPVMPSAVFLVVGNDRQPRSWIVGDAAINMARRQLSLFEPSPKRAIANRTLFLGGQDIPVTEAISAVLRVVAEEAMRQRGGYPPDAFVITHPATWSPARIQLLEEAARTATAHWRGWPQPSSITEPEAAAQRVLDIPSVPRQARIVVLDLGGGTADVAVVDRDGEILTVVGRPAGRDGLGGEDFDLRLARWMTEEVGHPGLYDRLAGSADPDERERAIEIRRHAQAVKEQLTRLTVVPAQLIKSPPELPDNTPVQVSRPQLEALIRGGEGREPGLCEAVQLVTEALKAAPPGPPLAGVFLVGGSSRIPLLGNLVRNQVRHAPLEHGDPATAVAEGAARRVWSALQVRQPLPISPELPPRPPWRHRRRVLQLLPFLLVAAGLAAYAATRDHTAPTRSICSNGTVVSHSYECPPSPSPSPYNQPSPEVQLQQQRNEDYASVEKLVGYWVPQLSTKKAGLLVNGKVFSISDVLADYKSLRSKYSTVLLFWSGDYSNYEGKDFWVTVLNHPYSSGQEANAWCDSEGINRDDCFAERLSHSGEPQGNTIHR